MSVSFVCVPVSGSLCVCVFGQLDTARIVSEEGTFHWEDASWQAGVRLVAASRCRPLIPAFRRLRQANLFEFKDSMFYHVSSRTTRTVIHRNHVWGGGLGVGREGKRKCLLQVGL